MSGSYGLAATGAFVSGKTKGWAVLGRWVAIIGGLVGATAAAADDLARAYALALDQDPTWVEAQARYAEVLADQELARAGYHPVLTLAGRATANHREVDGEFFGLDNLNRDDDFEALSYAIALRQPLLRLDRWRARDVAALRSGAALARLHAAESDLMLRVAEAYFAALDAEQDLEVFRAELQAIAERADQIREQTRLELATRAGQSEADAQRELAQARLLRARQALDTSRAELALLTGQLATGLARVPLSRALPPVEPANQQDWVEQARSSNPMLVAARLESEVAGRQVDVQRAARWPTVDLIAQREYLDNSGGVTGAREDSEDLIGLELRLSLFDGGEARARTSAAMARYQQALARQARALRQAEFDALRAYSALELGQAQIEALQAARGATYDAVEATEGGVFAGTRTAVDLVQSLRERFDAERALSRAIHAYLLNSLRLQAAAGTLGVDDLMAVNRLLSD
ncbi:hypothetical protein DEH80_08630 [Abyssibacter profundi]|uniref:Type I secretion protein TolC n=1 Tax=Abyssibacter profundi TaxID=2182787 RepID=A0A363ULN8_9GAMM|nr:hypothetical protein DEH80_08630 [Abyssibacter profundi]